jgi:hypothetical protein
MTYQHRAVHGTVVPVLACITPKMQILRADPFDASSGLEPRLSQPFILE